MYLIWDGNVPPEGGRGWSDGMREEAPLRRAAQVKHCVANLEGLVGLQRGRRGQPHSIDERPVFRAQIFEDEVLLLTGQAAMFARGLRIPDHNIAFHPPANHDLFPL